MPTEATALLRSQENMWEYVHCFAPDDPGRAGCNVFNTMDLSGPVDPDVFTAAVGDVAGRHDALRTVFARLGNTPLTRVVDEVTPEIKFVDLSAQPPARRSARLASILGYESHRDFDLVGGPLWTVVLARLTDSSHVVAVCLTHVIADGWSTAVFLRDLRAAYRARTGQGPPLAPPVVGYAEAMAPAPLSAAEVERRLEFWRQQLMPLPGPLPFPVTVPPAGSVIDVQAEASLGVTLPADTVRGLDALARRLQVTPYVLFLAAYRILLGVRTGWDRVVLGTATAGRDRPHSGDLVGQFSQNLYVATTIGPDATLAEAVGEVRSAVFAGTRNALPFTWIAAAVHPHFEKVRPWPYILLYHAWFISAAPGHAHGRPTGPSSEDTGIRENRVRGRPPTQPDRVAERLPLWIKKGEPNLTISDDRRTVFVRYNPVFYHRDMVAELVAGYRTVLGELLRDPHQRLSDLGAARPDQPAQGPTPPTFSIE